METRRVSDAANDKMESGEALPERSDRECDDKEETRRVSDAANDKLESGEALPERSDRECDEMEVPGAEAPDVTLFFVLTEAERTAIILMTNEKSVRMRGNAQRGAIRAMGTRV